MDTGTTFSWAFPNKLAGHSWLLEGWVKVTPISTTAPRHILRFSNCFGEHLVLSLSAVVAVSGYLDTAGVGGEGPGAVP